MGKFIVSTFLFLGWGFYEMSGGADFEPEERETTAVATVEAVTPVTIATRADTSALTASVQPVTLVLPAAEEPAVESQTTFAEVVEPVTEPVIETAPVDLRLVAGNVVNMRTGPGTNYGVLDKLTRGTEAEVIEVDASGWARIRVLESGQVGWMAARLLDEI